MFKGGGKGSRRGRGPVTKAPLKGLFSNGIWNCNCDPRLPAQRFQTKNGGKNHGRWFYTCQLPQPKRCDFFLWDDEAKGREAAAVLNNSRTEPSSESAPVTPVKSPAYGLLTPQTGHRSIDLDQHGVHTPYTPSKAPHSATMPAAKYNTNGSVAVGTATTAGSSDDEFYDWPASDEEEIGRAADQASSKQSALQTAAMPPPETPRKATRTDLFSTPGKRRFNEITGDVASDTAWPTPSTGHGRDEDVFTKPSTNAQGGNLFNANLQSPAENPTPIRYRDLPASQDSELATEILSSLQSALSAPLYSEAREKIKTICNRHVMFTRGIMKGRDVSRTMVKKKGERIVELEGEIEGLKSQRETDRAVIRHLRRDTAMRKAGGVI